MSTRFKKSLPLISWCLYGWASDTFPILITTFIFSTYFIEHIAANKISGTYLWANAASLAGLVIALTSSSLGSIADKTGRHKRWLAFFSFCAISTTAFLWFACPSPLCARSTLILFILGTISLELALVFYNSFLPRLAPPLMIGRISGWSWGLGYLGGIVALTTVLFFSVLYKPEWLNAATFEQIRIVAPFSALWFAVFCLPLFLFLPDTPATSLTISQSISQGLRELGGTLKLLVSEKNILLFLIARMIYTDGLNTLFAFGGIFAAGTFHFSFMDIIIFGITLNILAGFGAISFAWVDDYLGAKPTIILSLCCLIFFSTILLLTHERSWFWVTASLLSIFVGPVQAASRSLMAHLTPIAKSSEFFGLYALTGRITAFIGPWLLGLTTLHFQSQRAGMATLLLFFIIGLILLCRVQSKTAGEGQIAKS